MKNQTWMLAALVSATSAATVGAYSYVGGALYSAGIRDHRLDRSYNDKTTLRFHFTRIGNDDRVRHFTTDFVKAYPKTHTRAVMTYHVLKGVPQTAVVGVGMAGRVQQALATTCLGESSKNAEARAKWAVDRAVDGYLNGDGVFKKQFGAVLWQVQVRTLPNLERQVIIGTARGDAPGTKAWPEYCKAEPV